MPTTSFDISEESRLPEPLRKALQADMYMDVYIYICVSIYVYINMYVTPPIIHILWWLQGVEGGMGSSFKHLLLLCMHTQEQMFC